MSKRSLRNKLNTVVLVLLGTSLLLFSPRTNAAQQEQENPRVKNISVENRVAAASSLTQESLELDGKLEESSWKRASVLTDFIQHNPEEGTPATQKTEVRILYNNDFLFIGVHAFDSEPDKIKSIFARRDSRPPSDWIRIWIDSYYDHRTAFEFAVNPAGVKRDVFWSEDSKHDDDWDAVWDVEISINSEGWIAEFRIPFSQIRFPDKKQQVWGFQAGRVVARMNEVSYWRHVPKGVPQFVSLFGILTGIKRIPPPKRLQFLPYTVGKGAFEPAEEGNPFQTGSSYFAGAGLDLKYGLTSNLTIDATFNPDFGQVEADPAVVNLSAYETYFPEKRPFFIEGKNILNFSLGSGHARETLFYSRRIGRKPQGYPSNVDYSSIPESTTILGAFKMTGKTAQGWSIGIMEALTSREKAAVITFDGERTKQTVEPLSNYLLARIEKDFHRGRSAVGFIFTALNRKIDSDNIDFLRTSAYTGGLNFRHRWAKDTHEVKGFFIGSHIRGSEEAILKAQESSARYFQRPDAPHVEVDPTRTSLSGFAAAFSVGKIGGGHWRWSLGARTRSPGFEINDMGYMRDADEITQHLWLSYREYKPGKIFRDYDISFSLWNNWDYSPIHTSLGANLRFNFRFLNYWRINFNIHRSNQRLSTSHLRGGPAVLMPGNWRLSGSISTDSRKAFYMNIRGGISYSDNDAFSYNFSSGFTIRPSGRIHISLHPSFSKNYRFLKYVTKETSLLNTHYILSRLDQTTVSLTMRLNYTITPYLSLQLYSQPYISAGRYSEFKEAIEPRAQNYSNRWHVYTDTELFLDDGRYHVIPYGTQEEHTFNNPDFNFRQFRLNFVLRWEYLPGSILFLVWSNGMNDYISDGTFSLNKDLQGLFSSPQTNIFLVKISYWFNI